MRGASVVRVKFLDDEQSFPDAVPHERYHYPGLFEAFSLQTTHVVVAAAA